MWTILGECILRQGTTVTRGGAFQTFSSHSHNSGEGLRKEPATADRDEQQSSKWTSSMEKLTSTPSSPVYPQRVTLQSGIPNTVTTVEVMKVSLLRSAFSPAWSTWAIVGPKVKKRLGNVKICRERALALLKALHIRGRLKTDWKEQCKKKDTFKMIERRGKTKWMCDLAEQSGLHQWTPNPHLTRQLYTRPVWPEHRKKQICPIRHFPGDSRPVCLHTFLTFIWAESLSAQPALETT